MKTVKVGNTNKVTTKYRYNKKGKVVRKSVKTKNAGRSIRSNKLTDILDKLPNEQRAGVAKTFRRSQSADLLTTTSGTVGTGITGAIQAGKIQNSRNSNNNSSNLSPLVTGGITETSNRRDDDEDDFGGIN